MKNEKVVVSSLMEFLKYNQQKQVMQSTLPKKDVQNDGGNNNGKRIKIA